MNEYWHQTFRQLEAERDLGILYGWATEWKLQCAQKGLELIREEARRTGIATYLEKMATQAIEQIS